MRKTEALNIIHNMGALTLCITREHLTLFITWEHSHYA